MEIIKRVQENIRLNLNSKKSKNKISINSENEDIFVSRWNSLFGDLNLEKIINIVKKDWSTVKCFKFKECFLRQKKCPLLKKNWKKGGKK